MRVHIASLSFSVAARINARQFGFVKRRCAFAGFVFQWLDQRASLGARRFARGQGVAFGLDLTITCFCDTTRHRIDLRIATGFAGSAFPIFQADFAAPVLQPLARGHDDFLLRINLTDFGIVRGRRRGRCERKNANHQGNGHCWGSFVAIPARLATLPHWIIAATIRCVPVRLMTGTGSPHAVIMRFCRDRGDVRARGGRS